MATPCRGWGLRAALTHNETVLGVGERKTVIRRAEAYGLPYPHHGAYTHVGYEQTRQTAEALSHALE